MNAVATSSSVAVRTAPSMIERKLLFGSRSYRETPADIVVCLLSLISGTRPLHRQRTADWPATEPSMPPVGRTGLLWEWRRCRLSLHRGHRLTGGGRSPDLG